MKKIQLFVCEGCGTQYADEKEAIKCEKSHHKPKSFAEWTFKPYKIDSSGYPIHITVKFDDGNTITYHR